MHRSSNQLSRAGSRTLNTTAGTCLALGVAAIFAGACDKGPAGKEQGSSATGTNTSAGVMPAAPTGEQVKCLGIHECKGKSACHVAGGHACAGQNECKGKGWISVTKAECDLKGGKVINS
jgi:hypothetical protein